METVRSKVATAMEKSYSEFSAKEAAKMLMLSSVADLAEFAKHENERKAQREHGYLVYPGAPGAGWKVSEIISSCVQHFFKKVLSVILQTWI